MNSRPERLAELLPSVVADLAARHHQPQENDMTEQSDVAAALETDPPPCPCCLGDADTVCDACGQHSCWAGEFMCEDAATAGTRQASPALPSEGQS